MATTGNVSTAHCYAFSILRNVILAAVLLFTQLFAAAMADSRSLSLDDMLRVEGLGTATIDPTGRWLIYEQLRPYDEIPDYSFRTYAFGKSGHQLWRYDMASGAPPVLLPGLDPVPHAWLDGFSPSGRFLSLMQYRFGDLTISAYDMVRERSVSFTHTPAFSRAGDFNPVWISETDLVFSALPQGDQPATTSVRALTGKRLSEAWQDAWTGTKSTADEVRSRPSGADDSYAAGQLVRANALSGRTEILAEGLYADIRVSPDHSQLAALAVSPPDQVDPELLVENDPRHFTLTLFDLKKNEPRVLAGGLEFMPYTISWDPAGRRLAAFAWERGGDPRNGRFVVIDTSTGQVTRYDHTGLDLVSERERGGIQRPERVSFLGDRLAIFARKIPKGEDLAPRFSYQDLRPEAPPRADWYAVSPQGGHVNLTAKVGATSPIPVHAGPNELTVWGSEGIYRLDRYGIRDRLMPGKADNVRYLPHGTFSTRASLVRPDFADEAMFTFQRGGKAQIALVDLRAKQLGQSTIIDAPDADALPIAASIPARKVVFRTQTGSVTRVFATGTKSKAATTQIAKLNTHLQDIDFGKWSSVQYIAKDPEGLLPDRTLETCLVLPPDAEPGDRFPLIVDIYPGVAGHCATIAPAFDYPDPHSPHLWAGKGYAYARVATPSDFIRTVEGPIAGMPALIDAGVDALIDAGQVDPNRIALHGFSQGGISALYVAAHTSRYRAVIAKNSWADLFSHYFGAVGIYGLLYDEFGAYTGYDSVRGSDFGIGHTPFVDPGIYYRNSPVFLANQIDMPVLLMHSDLDSFDMAQFDEMFGALKREGKDVRYVRYWGEGHGPSSPANIRDMWKRMLTFLDEYGVAPGTRSDD